MYPHQGYYPFHLRADYFRNLSLANAMLPFRRLEIAFVALLILCGAVGRNSQFVDLCTAERVLAMNDVAGILQGFHATPHLLADGLRWWHGPWIQEGIGAFRPLSSYLLWADCFVGLRYGFFYTGCIGMLLLVANCALCVALAWRFTRSRAGVYTAALLAPAGGLFIMGGNQPPHWLVWFPVHHDLMMIAWLLGALLAFDCWLESARSRHLAWCPLVSRDPYKDQWLA